MRVKIIVVGMIIIAILEAIFLYGWAYKREKSADSLFNLWFVRLIGYSSLLVASYFVFFLIMAAIF